jgi:hypothetical protein
MHISIEGRPDIQLGLLYKIQEGKQIKASPKREKKEKKK